MHWSVCTGAHIGRMSLGSQLPKLSLGLALVEPSDAGRCLVGLFVKQFLAIEPSDSFRFATLTIWVSLSLGEPPPPQNGGFPLACPKPPNLKNPRGALSEPGVGSSRPWPGWAIGGQNFQATEAPEGSLDCIAGR